MALTGVLRGPPNGTINIRLVYTRARTGADAGALFPLERLFHESELSVTLERGSTL